MMSLTQESCQMKRESQSSVSISFIFFNLIFLLRREYKSKISFYIRGKTHNMDRWSVDTNDRPIKSYPVNLSLSKQGDVVFGRWNVKQDTPPARKSRTPCVLPLKMDRWNENMACKKFNRWGEKQDIAPVNKRSAIHLNCTKCSVVDRLPEQNKPHERSSSATHRIIVTDQSIDRWSAQAEKADFTCNRWKRDCCPIARKSTHLLQELITDKNLKRQGSTTNWNSRIISTRRATKSFFSSKQAPDSCGLYVRFLFPQASRAVVSCYI